MDYIIPSSWYEQYTLRTMRLSEGYCPKCNILLITGLSIAGPTFCLKCGVNWRLSSTNFGLIMTCQSYTMSGRMSQDHLFWPLAFVKAHSTYQKKT